MTADPRTPAAQDLDDAIWTTVVPGRAPDDVAAALRSWGVQGALAGADTLIREMDPGNLARTAGMDPLAPDGVPLDHDVLRWSLAQTLRYRAGMTLDGGGAA